jgi:hypothetical protein
MSAPMGSSRRAIRPGVDGRCEGWNEKPYYESTFRGRYTVLKELNVK